MNTRRRLTVGATVAASLAAAALAVAIPRAALAHGAMLIPGSRTWLCYEDAITPQGSIVPNNPACAAAVAQSGTNSLYNWFAVLRSDGAGRTRGFIPDGKLCSAAATVYDFSGFDLARSDWPVTHLTAGASMEFHYNKWAAHPGWFYLYVTKDGWNPNTPLTWDELEETAFSSADHLRRRSAPVMASIRRCRAGPDTPLVSSLRSTLRSKRCLLMDRHHAHGALRANVGAGYRLPWT